MRHNNTSTSTSTRTGTSTVPTRAHDPNGPILTKDGEHTLVQNTLPHLTQMRSVETEKDKNMMRK